MARNILRAILRVATSMSTTTTDPEGRETPAAAPDTRSPAVLRAACYLVFGILMAIDILVSAVVVVCFYLPFVGLKAAWMIATGKVRPKTRTSAAERTA